MGTPPDVDDLGPFSTLEQLVRTLRLPASDTDELVSRICADACRIVPTARKLDRVSYEEMLELAACGAKILHLRCVEYARRYDIPIHVRSSFSQKVGTIVTGLIAKKSPEKVNVQTRTIVLGVIDVVLATAGVVSATVVARTATEPIRTSARPRRPVDRRCALVMGQLSAASSVSLLCRSTSVTGPDIRLMRPTRPGGSATCPD